MSERPGGIDIHETADTLSKSEASRKILHLYFPTLFQEDQDPSLSLLAGVYAWIHAYKIQTCLSQTDVENVSEVYSTLYTHSSVKDYTGIEINNEQDIINIEKLGLSLRLDHDTLAQAVDIARRSL